MAWRAGTRWPRRGAEARARRPLIGLTPLIDVVFILLIFFMLASSYLDWRAIALDTPAAAAGEPAAGALFVEVRAGGLRLSGRPTDLDALAGTVAERARRDPDLRVVVQAEADVALQRTVDVLDRLSVAGVARLSLTSAPGG